MKSTLINFYSSFDFCQAKDDEKAPQENLGQVVFGDRISPSPYKLSFLNDEECVTVCEKNYKVSNSDDIRKLRFLKKAVILNYQHHWIIDNLPVIWCYETDDGKEYCSRGFPVGCYVSKTGQKKDACRIFVRKKKSFFLV